MTNSPIFIVGTPRSGTTLTANILDRHSHIYIKGENHFFEDIYSRKLDLNDETIQSSVIEDLLTIYGRYNQGKDQERINNIFSQEENINKLRTAANDYCTLLTCFMHIQKKDEGKARWGNNTPKDLFHIKEILGLYPDAKFIICVRDPRDFILSYKNRWKVTTQEHRERLRKLYHPVVTAMLWKSSMNQVLRTNNLIPDGNSMIVKYELLVSQPEIVVREICNVIDEKYEESMLNVTSNNSSAINKEQGIYSSSIGNWRDGLNREDIYLIQKIANREMKSFGYDSENISASLLRVLGILFQFPHALYVALKANKGNRGPLLSYLKKRGCSLFQRG